MAENIFEFFSLIFLFTGCHSVEHYSRKYLGSVTRKLSDVNIDVKYSIVSKCFKELLTKSDQ